MIVPGNPEFDAEMEAIAHGRRFRMVTHPRELAHAPRMPDVSLIHPIGGKRKLMSETVCRMCERQWVNASCHPLQRTRHHLVPQSWFLGVSNEFRAIRHAHANLIPLCRACHDDIETKNVVIRLAARMRLRGRMTQQEVAFAIALRGLVWMNREYPVDPDG